MTTEVGVATEVDAEALSSENVYWIDFRCVKVALCDAAGPLLCFAPEQSPRSGILGTHLSLIHI
eukprot:485486-Rhodomonas_salina.2